MNLAALFTKASLLDQALIHRSYLNEHPQVRESNERLEFLGDAVLELIITQNLFHQFPDKPEGELTTLRAALVKTETLAQVAQALNLGSLLKLSRGEVQSGGRTNLSLLANTLEAVIGALYLDQGLTATQAFIQDHILPLLPDILAKGLYRDFKSTLQETAQARGLPAPHYRVISALGPDHHKLFTVTANLNGRSLGQGSGPNKQAAQQQAAQLALEKLTQTR